MLKAEQIPDEVVRAALLTDERLGMREVILAAINAWPGMTWACRGKGTPPHLLFLPLPTEKRE